MYVGDFEDLETKDLNEMIDDYGKTLGLANYLAVSAVLLLEEGKQWEGVRNFFHEVLVDFIDE